VVGVAVDGSAVAGRFAVALIGVIEPAVGGTRGVAAAVAAAGATRPALRVANWRTSAAMPINANVPATTP